jgi:hypothetical protein
MGNGTGTTWLDFAMLAVAVLTALAAAALELI